MSDPRPVIECTHGGGAGTFVCVHLAEGVACGFHADEPTAADPWPDAWCDGCERVRAEAGEWNDENMDALDIRFLCEHHYVEVRERNREVSPLLAGQVGFDEKSYGELVLQASGIVKALQEKAEQAFGLGRHDRWAADYDAARFTLVTGGETQVVADLQIVGSFSTKNSSWLWSWANEIHEPHLVRGVAMLRALGEARGIRFLADAYHEGVDEVHCWEMTSLACHVLGYDACYRAPMDHRLLFMLLKNLRWTA